MKNLTILYVFLFLANTAFAQNEGKIINLNGQWDFEQTVDAFPPQKFTRKCPVPGLIHLAELKIDAYDKLFKRPDQVLAEEAYDYRKLQYEPRYSWYKKVVNIPADLNGSEAMISNFKKPVCYAGLYQRERCRTIHFVLHSHRFKDYKCTEIWRRERDPYPGWGTNLVTAAGSRQYR